MQLEDKIEAENLKTKGNEAFVSKDYKKAIETYQRAIERCGNDPVMFSNIAQCFLLINDPDSAARSARQALLLDPSLIKGKYRLAMANMKLKMYKEALDGFLSLPEQNITQKIKEMIQECKKEYRISRFLESIYVDPFFITESVICQTQLHPNYNGPRLDKINEITPSFVSDLMEYFYNENKLPLKYVYCILLAAKTIMQKETNVISIKKPADGRLTICGDTHGQFFDLIKIFNSNGTPSTTHSYLFNGDIVDRGAHSVEIAILLLAFKACYPYNFYLSRGNHETESMNRIFGFEEEILTKYDRKTYSLFKEVFNTIPLAYVVDEKYFVVHGGIHSADLTIEQINKEDRFKEPERASIVSTLLWSDPGKDKGIKPSPRNEGVVFGPDITEGFLVRNNLSLIIRSHVWKEQGYEYEHNGKCLTIFSAPDYAEGKSNAAFINIGKENNFDIIQFEAASFQGNKRKKPVMPRAPMCF